MSTFGVYKALEYSETSVEETCSRSEAVQIIATSIQWCLDVLG